MKAISEKLNTNYLFILKEAALVFLKMLLVNLGISTVVSSFGLKDLEGEVGLAVLILVIIIHLIFFILFMFESCYKFYLRLRKQIGEEK